MSWGCESCNGDNPERTRFCGHCGTRRDELVEVGETTLLSRTIGERLVDAATTGMVEERRVVTALFADVSGFTALGNQLDPEQLHAVIDPVVSHLSEIVGRYEGFVGKYAGDAILGFFGAPIAHEDDPVRAVMAARDMMRELPAVLAALDPEHAKHLTLHIGVNTGPVVAGFLGGEARMDYSVLGDAVNVAQRLEAAASGGEVYVGQPTYELTKDAVPFEYVGELQVKGKPEPVRAWRLVTGAAVSQVTMESEAPSANVLYGRETEVEAALAVLSQVVDSQSGAVLAIVAEPGVGKTRLAQEVWRLAEGRDVQWMATRCLSYGAGLPYWPYAELLRRLTGLRVEDAPADATATLAEAMGREGLSEHIPSFARLLGVPSPDGSPDAADLEPAAFRRALHDAFAAWLRTMTGSGPAVLAIEDVHWLDSASASLTMDLVRRCADVPVLFFVTARPEGSMFVEGLVGAMAAATRIELGPLQRHAVIQLAAGLIGGAPPEELVDALEERTGGNPLFAQEVVRALLDANALVLGAEGWRMRTGWTADAVPPTVEKVLAARIDLLPRQTAHVLQVASVIGRQIRPPLLHAVVPEVRGLEAIIDGLVESGFIDRIEEGGAPLLLFHHALIVDVAYERLLRSHRRDLHARLAVVGESIYGSGDDTIELLARHAYLGEMGAKAVTFLTRAAARARRLYANEQAIDDLNRALDVARADPDAEAHVPDLLLEVGDLEELVGRYEDAMRVYSEVRTSTGDVRAWRGLASTLRITGEHDRALELIEEALATAPPGADRAALLLEKGTILAATGRVDEGLQSLMEGLQDIAGSQDPLAGQLLQKLAEVEEAAGDHDGAIEHGEAAVEHFVAAADLRHRVSALRFLGGAYRVANRDSDAETTLRQGLELARRIGSAFEIASCANNLAITLIQQGRPAEEATPLFRLAVEEFERAGSEAQLAMSTNNLAFMLLQQGLADEAHGQARRATDLARSIGHTVYVSQCLDTLAWALLALGRSVEAAETAEEAGTLFESLHDEANAANSLECAVKAYEALGDADRAQAIAARARSLAQSDATTG